MQDKLSHWGNTTVQVFFCDELRVAKVRPKNRWGFSSLRPQLDGKLPSAIKVVDGVLRCREGKTRAQSFILVGSVPHRFQIEEDAALYEEEEIPKKRRDTHRT